MQSTADSVERVDPMPSTRVVWLLLLTGASFLFSMAFACATPFAAFATLMALRLEKRDRVLALSAVWIINQAVGYGLLGYKLNWNSCAWGLLILLSAGLGVCAARTLAATRPGPLAISLPFASAFVAFEAGLYLAALMLPGGSDAFSVAVISHVFFTNVVAFCVLLVVYHLMMPALRLLRASALLALPTETASSH